ncbi:uncharacterized protein armh4 [Aplochiton taeniatus]
MRAENGDSGGGRSGPCKAGEKEGSQEREAALESSFDRQRASEPETKPNNMEEASVTNMARWTSAGQEQVIAAAVNTPRADLLGATAPPAVTTEPDNPGQRETVLKGEPVLENDPQVEQESTLTLSSLEGPPIGQESEAGRPPTPELLRPSGWTPRGTSFSVSLVDPILSPSHSSLPHISQSVWGLQEGATTPTLPDLLLPDLGPDLTLREEGPDSLWTEPLQQSGVDTVAPLSQDEATEGTMSSEDLPLIFDPFDDVTPDRSEAAVTFAPGSLRPPAAMATRGMGMSEAEPGLASVAVETEGDGQSPAPSLDWTLPWQTSGAELSEPISTSGPSATLTAAESKTDVSMIQPSEETPITPGLVWSSAVEPAMTTVTKAIPPTVSRAKSGLEELESEEEPDEDEENEDTEESEEESEEDLTETPQPAPTRLPYSLIPPPPVWVQRNQGLMRSWVELIREKAGYVSGMLAPVGIGIAGALLIVGALYSIRMIHRKRRSSFKHQRRKVRQTEQPREPSTNCQDQAMLLADSSEDEF